MENKMFCYQCQETAGCTGCTKVGVCGISPELARLQDLLIYTTKGLSEVTTRLREEGKTIDTTVNHLITINLFSTITNANFDDAVFYARIKETLATKETLLAKLNNKEKEIISLKIISNLSFEEIGKLLKEPTGTIKWRYYKAVNTLKILLSNLGMFIITFVIGIKTLFNKKASDKVEQDKTIGNNTTEQTGENTNAETKKGQENLKDEVKSDVSESQDKETRNEINIVSQPTNTEIINNSGVCILSISFIFLIITIIFSIILAKYQLKLRKKLSK